MELSMKKLALSLVFLAIAGSANAHGYYRGGGYWVGPAIVGGIVGYELGRPRYEPYYYPPVVVQQPQIIYQQPVYVQQATQPQQQVCEQKTFQQPNGQIVSGNFCYYK